MKQAIRSALRSLLAVTGAFPTPVTATAEVRELIARLAPVRPGHDLIRLGPPGDGGYLVPDDLDGIAACFSPGVSEIAGFEIDCAERGIDVFLADKSVERPPETHERFSFTRKFIGATNDDDFMTLDAWVAASVAAGRSDLLLQMDIEGFEYETLLATPQSVLDRFRVLVIEFHNLDMLWSRPYFDLVSRAIGKLLATHTCVHIHPNNFYPPLRYNGLEIPPLLEMTFLRTDRVTHSGWAAGFPHPLDHDNTARAHFALPACWYRNA